MSEIKKDGFFNVKTNGVLNFSVKDIDTTGRKVQFVLSTLNYLDFDKDVLMSGCFNRSINNNGPESSAPDKIQHALNHDLNVLVGKYLSMEESSYDFNGKTYSGLICVSQLSKSSIGNDTLINYQEGIYNQHSIGYQYVKADWVERDGHGNSQQWSKVVDELVNPEDLKDTPSIYKVSEVKLYEGSTVSFGANKLTPTLGIKSDNKESYLLKLNDRMDLLEEQMRNGKQSDEEMKRFAIQVLQIKQIMKELIEYKKVDVDKSESENKIDWSKIALSL